MNRFDYRRRQSREVVIGGVALGGKNPIRLQSMTNTSTLDTDGSVAQCCRIADAGADYVRLTAQGVREAENIGVIRQILRHLSLPTYTSTLKQHSPPQKSLTKCALTPEISSIRDALSARLTTPTLNMQPNFNASTKHSPRFLKLVVPTALPSASE
jgi:hypothetical protein